MVTKSVSPKKSASQSTATTKNASTKKVATKKVAEIEKPIKTTTPRKKKAVANTPEMIEIAAYYLAEKHGFNGNPADFWLKAEESLNK
jgi:hypothetical protein